MAESTTSINWEDDDAQQWEICNDNGFVYKRRRRRHNHQPPPPPSPNPKAKTIRSRKKKALLALKLKYQQELHQWRQLTPNPQPPTTATAAADEPSSPPPPPPPSILPQFTTEIDELLHQVEAQQTIIAKLSEVCDCVESLCDATEEREAEKLMELPVWGSPRRLVASLTSLFSSS